MTLDEAIAHEKELSKEIYIEAMLCHANPDDEKLDGCIEDGRYHERLAEWLEDYKHIKQWKSDVMDDFCRYDVSSFEELVANARNKAIDDFVKEVKDLIVDLSVIKFKHIDEIAEQLKAGVANDWQRVPETSQEKAIIHF